MRTTLDIDEALLAAVQRKLGLTSKTAAIEAALREVLEREERVARALRLHGAYPNFRLPEDEPGE